ncbi:MAG: YaeQ family protein [Gammaproteobacteria bacterium]|nr:YaeQ family protein [Gammaproteobacteria bacterium]
MAISSTINKVSINIANVDQNYYQSHQLTVAKHPSENDFRFMMRLIAFMLNASETLKFSKGLSTDDEPELWSKDLTAHIELWIDFGQVDEKRIRKACGRAEQVIIYTYHEPKAKTWWQQQQQKLARFNNLSIYHIHAENIETMVKRSMQLQCNIMDDELYLSDEDSNTVVLISKTK